jgi:3-oxoadipate CoA-transferase beta subunit
MFPLTAPGCVTRVYTDLAVLDVADGAFVVHELVEGLTLRALREITGAPVVES